MEKISYVLRVYESKDDKSPSSYAISQNFDRNMVSGSNGLRSSTVDYASTVRVKVPSIIMLHLSS